MILLLIGCVESHPGEFYKYYFYYLSHAVQVKMQKSVYLQFITNHSKNIIAYYLTSKVALNFLFFLWYEDLLYLIATLCHYDISTLLKHKNQDVKLHKNKKTT